LNAPAEPADSRHGRRQHLDRIPPLIRRISIGKHLTDVAGRHGTEYGVGESVSDSIAVGMTFEVNIARDWHASKNERAWRRTPV
jgi:hypothetical protein